MAKNEFVPLGKVISVAAMTSTQKAIIVTLGRKTIELALFANQGSGNVAATTTVHKSYDYIDPGNGDAAGITAAEARATWHAFTSGLANPAAVALDSLSGPLSIACNAVRVTLTFSSGSGPVQLDAHLLSL